MPGKRECPYNDYSSFLQKRYGCRVYRVPVDLGLSCPHRSLETDGCTYCGNFGARAAHLTQSMSLEEQVDTGIALARTRYGAEQFAAYFQAHTATNAAVETLHALFERVLKRADFRALIVATRPDCLPGETLAFLQDLAEYYDVWVELGVQSVHDATLSRLNRCHDFACTRIAVEALAKCGINTAAHVILGLPGEGLKHFRQTAKTLSKFPFRGIKIHNLHVVRDTPLAKDWRNGRVRVLDEHEYGEVLMDFLRFLPAEWQIMRMVCDTPADLLLAPRWWLKKSQFIDYIETQMLHRGWVQGDLSGELMSFISRDGQFDLNIASAGESSEIDLSRPEAGGPCAGDLSEYPGKRGNTVKSQSAATEAHPSDCSGLEDSLHRDGAVVVDFGFGLGHGAIDMLHQLPKGRVEGLSVTAFGLDPGVMSRCRDAWPDLAEFLDLAASNGKVRLPWGSLKLYWGDPRRKVNRIRGKADIIVLEPYSAEQFAQLYSIDFLRRVASHLRVDGILVSGSRAWPVRSALARLGLTVGKWEFVDYAGRHSGTFAAWQPELVKCRLTEREHYIIEATVSALPFRDPRLNANRNDILRHRGQAAARLRAKGWRRRVGGSDA